jgi:hypothetical protein
MDTQDELIALRKRVEELEKVNNFRKGQIRALKFYIGFPEIEESDDEILDVLNRRKNETSISDVHVFVVRNKFKRFFDRCVLLVVCGLHKRIMSGIEFLINVINQPVRVPIPCAFVFNVIDVDSFSPEFIPGWIIGGEEDIIPLLSGSSLCVSIR